MVFVARGRLVGVVGSSLIVLCFIECFSSLGVLVVISVLWSMISTWL